MTLWLFRHPCDLFKAHVRRYRKKDGTIVSAHERTDRARKHVDVMRHENERKEDVHEGAHVGPELVKELTDKKWKHREVPAVTRDGSKKAGSKDQVPPAPTIPGKNRENSALISAQRTINRMHEAAQQSEDPVAALMAFGTSRANPYLKAVDDYRTSLLEHFGYKVDHDQKHSKYDKDDHTIIISTRDGKHYIEFAGTKAKEAEAVQSVKGRTERKSTEVKKTGEPTFVKGDENAAYTGKMNKVRSTFALVELEDLTTSHTYDGHINTAYPAEIQPRDRARVASRLQIQNIAADLKPELYGVSHMTSDGAPIVGPDGIVESGNGRTLALGLAYKKGDGEGYREWLKGYADKVGISTKDVAKMKQPVLVRVRETPVNRAEFAKEANQSNMMHNSPVEMAFSDAERISDDMLAKYQPDEYGDVLAEENRPFVKDFLDKLGKNEAAGMLDKYGEPNKKLVDRIQAAVFARVYRSEVLTELMVESADSDVRNIINAMNASAADYAKIQKYSDLDVTDNLLEAIDHIRTAKRNNFSIDNQLDQATFDANGNAVFVDHVTEKLTRVVHEYKGSRRKLTDFFKALTSKANREIVEREDAAQYGGDIFGNTRQEKDKGQLISEAAQQLKEGHDVRKAQEATGADRSREEEARHDRRNQGADRRQARQEKVTHPTLLIKAARKLQGRLDFNGLPISVENRMGSIRQWFDPHTDQQGMTRMKRPYGYIRGTLGTDGDAVDVYVGPYRDAPKVYVITQMKAPEFTEVDEEKCLLGFRTKEDARKFYLQHYDDPRFLGKITGIPFEEFRQAVMQTKGNGGEPIVKALLRKSHVRAYLRRVGDKIVATQQHERNTKRKQISRTGEKGVKGLNDDELRRLALARGYRVPPGWGKLWVNADPNAHLQVRCVDAKGRTVRIYHPEFEQGNAKEKFDRMKAFAFAHGRLMRRIKADMAEKDEAKVLYLIASTGFRLGSDSDTKAEQKAYGASNLTSDHIEVKGNRMTFRFTGKKGVGIEHTLTDKTLADMLRDKQGRLFDTNDAAVRKYMADLTDGNFTPKDFRTFVANEEALRVMETMPEPTSPTEAKRHINKVCDAVAAKLGNTRTVTKSAYIAPEIWGIWKHAS